MLVSSLRHRFHLSTPLKLFNVHQWLLVALILLGAFLVLHHLDFKSLRGDEMIANRVGLWSLSEILQDILTKGRNVSWHWFLIHFFSSPDLPFLPRFPSAMFMILSIPLAYQAGTHLGSRSTGLLTALLMAISPLNIQYGQDARMYSGLVVVSLLILLAAYRALDQAAWKAWLWLAVAAAACILTHVYAILPLAATLTWIGLVSFVQLWQARRRKQSTMLAWLNLRRLALILLWVGGIFGLQVIVLSGNTFGRQGVVQTVFSAPQQFLDNIFNEESAADTTPVDGQAEAAPTQPTVPVVPSILARLSDYSLGAGWPLAVFSILWLMALSCLLLYRPRVAVLALLWVGLPLVILTTIYVFILKRSEIPSRYLIYLLPITQFLTAQGVMATVHGLRRIWPRWLVGAAPGRAWLVAPAVMLLLIPLNMQRVAYYYAQPQTNDFKSPCLFLAHAYTNGDIMLVEDRLNTQDGYRLYCQGLPPAITFRSLDTLQSSLVEDARAWVYAFVLQDEARVWLDAYGFKIPFAHVTVYQVVDGGRGDVAPTDQLRFLQQASEQAPTTKEVLSLLGRTYMQIGRYEDARQLFERYLRLFPGEPQTTIQLGAAYEQLGDLDKAEKLYREAGRHDSAGILALAALQISQGRIEDAWGVVTQLLAQDNRLVAAHLMLAQLQQVQGDLAGAEESLSTAAELEPENLQVWLKWAALALAQNDAARAETSLLQAIKVAPTQAAGHLQLAALYVEQARLSEAITLFDQAVAIDANNPNTYFQRGNLLNDMGEPARALSDYQTALRLSDRLQLTEAAARRAADILITQGQAESALALVNAALETQPDSGSLFVTQANVFLALAQSSTTTGQQLLNLNAAEQALNAARQRLPADDMQYAQARATWSVVNGRPQEAIDSLRLAAEAQSSNANLWRDLANAQIAADQYAAAEVSLQQAIALAPERADLHAQLGEVLTLQNNPAAAVSELESAISLEPTNSNYQRALGDAYAAAGNTPAAVAAYEKALELQPGLVAVHRQLATLYGQTNECALATSHLEIVVNSEGASAGDYLTLGDVYAACGEAQAAIVSYERAIAAIPVRAYFKLGQLYASLGQIEEAVTAYEAVILAAPGSEFAQTARDWLLAQGIPLPSEITSPP